MRILVTGGAGFIGSHLVEKLVEKGYDVVVLDNFTTGRMENLAQVYKDIEIVRGDILDRQLVHKLVKNIDAVVHLAAKISVEESMRDPQLYMKVNSLGTRIIAEEASQNSVELLVYMSSAAVYGNSQYIPVDEDLPRKPLNLYGLSKLKGEEVIMEVSEKSELPSIIVRLFNAYGPRQEGNPYAGVIAKFIMRVKKRLPPIVYSPGSQTRDFIHVYDVASFLSMLITRNIKDLRIYNLGTGRETSIIELAKIIIDISGLGVEPEIGPPRPNDIMRSVADIGKAVRELGWRPRIDLREGLKTLLVAE